MMKKLINFLLFQAGWFVIVIGVNSGAEVTAMICIVLIIFIHLYFVRDKAAESFLIVAAGLMGFAVDSLLVSQGLFSTLGEISLQGMAPAWLVSLWMLFAITINHSLYWLRSRYLLSAIAGFIFAPVAYFAGYKFGVLIFSPDHSKFQLVLMIGLIWAVVMPTLLLISRVASGRYFVLTN